MLVDRVNALLAAANLPSCRDIAPQRPHLADRAPASHAAYGLTALETRYGLSGVDTYNSKRREVPKFGAPYTMTLEERVSYLECEAQDRSAVWVL